MAFIATPANRHGAGAVPPYSSRPVSTGTFFGTAAGKSSPRPLIPCGSSWNAFVRKVNHPSAVVGSMTDLISEIRLAGNPPCRACSRTISSFGAMYRQ